MYVYYKIKIYSVLQVDKTFFCENSLLNFGLKSSKVAVSNTKAVHNAIGDTFS